MNENISIFISAILVILLIVLLPLLNILDRQDNISYNVVLTLTTNFVDDVRSKGFIDKESYYEYLGNIANTGNVYDITIEAHKKILYDTGTRKLSYEEATIIYNKNDVEKKLDDDEIYEFDVGDKFYIKIFNTNIPSSSIVYRYIANVDKYKVVNISYGGFINKINHTLYEKSVKDYDHIPYISIGLPKDKNKNVHETLDISGSYQYAFNLNEVDQKEITLKVNLKNFHIFSDTTKKTISVNQLKDYIDVKGVETCKLEILDALENPCNEISTDGKGESSFYIKISGIRLDSNYTNASVIIYPNLGESDDGIISQGYESVKFSLFNDVELYSLFFDGPYYENGNKVGLKNGIITVYKRSAEIQKIFFKLMFTSIYQYEDDIADAVRDNLYMFFDYSRYNGPLSASGFMSEFYYEDPYITEYNNEHYFGTVKVPLQHKKDSVYPGYLGIDKEWIEDLYGNTLGIVEEKSNNYVVDIDDKEPEGKLIVKNSKKETAELNASGQYLVNTRNIFLDTIDIEDEKSGLYKITIDDRNKQQEYEYEDSKRLEISWRLINDPGDPVEITYKVEDNVGNVLTETLEIVYTEDIKSEFWLTKDGVRELDKLPENKWIKQKNINIHIDTKTIAPFSVSAQAKAPNRNSYAIADYLGQPGENTEYDKKNWRLSPPNDIDTGIWAITVKTTMLGTPSSETKQYYIDNEEPVITPLSATTDPASDKNGYYKQYTIPITIKDNHSGLYEVNYIFTNSNSFPIGIDTSWNKIQLTNLSPGTEHHHDIKTSLNHTGTYYLHLKAYDNALNCLSQSIPTPYKIDNAPPVIDVSSVDALGNVGIEVVDNESGIKSIQYAERNESEEEGSWSDPISWTSTTYASYRSSVTLSNSFDPNKYVWIQAEDNLGNIENLVVRIKCDPPEIEFKIGSEIGENDIGILAEITTNAGINVAKSEYGWSMVGGMPANWLEYKTDINGENIVGKNGFIKGSKFDIGEVADGSKHDLHVKITDKCNNESHEKITVNRELPEIKIKDSILQLTDLSIGDYYYMQKELDADKDTCDYTIPIAIKTNDDYQLYSFSFEGVLAYPNTHNTHPSYEINVVCEDFVEGIETINPGFEIMVIDRLGNTKKITTIPFKFETIKP